MRNSKHHDKSLNTHKAKGATRQLRKEFILIYLVISLVLIGLHALPPVNQLNNYLYDQFIQLNPISSSNDIIVIRIDDHAIDELGWPISRDHYTQLLTRLNHPNHQPKAIGIALMFAQSRPGDGDLANQLSQHATVLPIEYSALSSNQPGTQLSAPVDPLRAQSNLSHTEVTFDDDGIVRGFNLTSNGFWHFSSALVLAAQPEKMNELKQRAEKSNYVRFRPIDPTKGYASLSLLDLLQPNYPLTLLKDRYLLIGVTTHTLGDTYPTLYSNATDLNTSGIELLASALQGLLDDTLITSLPNLTNMAISLSILLLIMLGFLRFNLLAGLLLSLALITLYFLGSYLLLNQSALWLAPGALIISTLILQSIWAWRRLSEVIKAMDKRLFSYKDQHGNDKTQEIVVQYTQLLEQVMDANEQALELLELTIEELPDAIGVFNESGLLMSNQKLKVLAGDSLKSGFALSALLNQLNLDPKLNELASSTPVTIHNSLNQEGEYLVKLKRYHHSSFGELSIINLTDVTQLQSVLRQKQRAMQFLSHDMRTPLAAIITLIQTDIESKAPTHTVQNLINKCQHMLSMMDDLTLILSNSPSDQSFRAELIDNILLDAIDQVAELANQKNIAINIEQDHTKHLFIAMHAKTFTRALVNLLVNSIKYAPSDTPITLSIELSGSASSWITLSISNEMAPGITTGPSPDHLITSHGLGHDFVNQVIKNHQGFIDIDMGEHHKNQATVTLSLPIVNESIV